MVFWVVLIGVLGVGGGMLRRSSGDDQSEDDNSKAEKLAVLRQAFHLRTVVLALTISGCFERTFFVALAMSGRFSNY